MSSCLCKIEHDKCGSSDALQVFDNEDGTVTGYCFSCGTFVPNPLGEQMSIEEIKEKYPTRVKKTPEEVQEEIDEIGKLPVCDIKERRLRRAALDYFDVKVGYDERDGKTPRLVFFPYTKDGKVVRYKVRLLGQKKMWCVGSGKDIDLFGWKQAVETGAKTLLITEGEYDAVALRKIIETYTKDSFREYMPAVVSLPDGAQSAKKVLNRLASKIKSNFKEVVLVFDEDDAGKKAVEDALKVLPYARVAELPCKDANEALILGLGKAVWKSVTFSVQKPKNTRLVKGSELAAEAMKRPEMGLSWPYEGLTKLTRGIRRGETYYFGAG